MSVFIGILRRIFGLKDEDSDVSSSQPFRSSASVSSTNASSSSSQPFRSSASVSSINASSSSKAEPWTEPKISQSLKAPSSCSLHSTEAIPSSSTYPSRIPPIHPNRLFVPSDTTNQLRRNNTAVQNVASSHISNPTSGSSTSTSSFVDEPLQSWKGRPALFRVPSNSIDEQKMSKVSFKSSSSFESPKITLRPTQSSSEPKISTQVSPSYPLPQATSFKQSPSSSEASRSGITTPSSKHIPPSKPNPSPVPSNSTNQQNRTESIGVQTGSSSSIPKSTPASSGIPSSFPKSTPSCKPTLLPLRHNSTGEQEELGYVWGEKGTLPIYMIPEDIKRMIEREIVPEVLKKPLSPSTYRDYFAALLYAEDFYIEKWSEFQLSNVTLELKKASIYKNKNFYEDDEAEEKAFAEFEIDKIRESRPFLLSRDFVFAGPPGTKTKEFQGFVYRVVKGNVVVTEFQGDFHAQHYPTKRYDISFSFNRECLKRAHKAIEAALDSSLLSFLFPDPTTRKSLLRSHHPISSSNCDLDMAQLSAINLISSFQGPPAYLIQGPSCLTKSSGSLSRTGAVIREAVLHIYRVSPDCRILICAPLNRTCDVLMISLKKVIQESEIFRANAAFREVELVPDEILSSCPYEGECFVCPSISELENYKVILSTFVSAFRLWKQGIRAGHFTHIFLVDASSASEPEAMVALANLVNNSTAVIVTGSIHEGPRWIRSDLGRRNGLNTSYFARLYKSRPYLNLDPAFVTNLEEYGPHSGNSYGFESY